MKLITVQWTQKRKKNNNNNILTFSTKRFQTPTESQYAKARRKRKDSEGTHMCQVQTLIGWQQSPLGHQNLTRLFISSNISVVAIVLNQSLRGIYITSGYGSHRLFEARPRIFLPIAQSCAALLCCRLAILESSLEWLVGNHDPQHCILHAFSFEKFHCLNLTFIFSNLFNLEKFSAFINSFSVFSLILRLPYFIATVS